MSHHQRATRGGWLAFFAQRRVVAAISVRGFRHARGSVKRSLAMVDLASACDATRGSGVEPSPSRSDLRLPPVVVHGSKHDARRIGQIPSACWWRGFGIRVAASRACLAMGGFFTSYTNKGSPGFAPSPRSSDLTMPPGRPWRGQNSDGEKGSHAPGGGNPLANCWRNPAGLLQSLVLGPGEGWLIRPKV